MRIEFDNQAKNETYTRHKKYEIDHSKLPAPKKYKDAMNEKFESKDDEKHRNDPDIVKVHGNVIKNEMLEHFEKQVIYGFIKPNEIVRRDYLLSYAQNPEEQERIIAICHKEDQIKLEEEKSNRSKTLSRMSENYNFDGTENSDEEVDSADPRKKKRDCSYYFIISRKGKCHSYLRFINISLCLISSYIYVWMACFGDDPLGLSFKLMIVFEGMFFIMMICNFVTDFTRNGENIACDDLEEIAVNYIQSDFLTDLIPLLPFNAFLDNSMK